MIPFGTAVKTRLIYVVMFLMAVLSCWVFINWGPLIVAKVPSYIFDAKFCEEHHCFGAISVYRITFGLALFHAAQALLFIGVRRTSDCRAMLQNGFWLVKLAALVGLLVAAFYIPLGFFVYYGWTALVASVVFLFIQLVLLVDFAHSWSESWLGKYADDPSKVGWFRALMACTVLLYAASLGLVVAMFVLFASTQQCGLNAVFISVALLAGIALSCLAIHPKIQERSPKSGLLQPAVVTLYMVYLVWSAIMSEPVDSDLGTCNTITKSTGVFDSGAQKVGTLMGAFLVIVAVCYSAVRTSSQHDTLLGSDTIEEALPIAKSSSKSSGASQSIDEVAAAAEGTSLPPSASKRLNGDLDSGADSSTAAAAAADEPVGYNYAFFHFIFTLASMYICMLMTNWSVVHNDVDPSSSPMSMTMMMQANNMSANAVSIDQSMASVWIKVASSWLVGILFAWSLVAPVIFQNRDFGS